MDTYTRPLTLDQRAFIVGEQGICASCEKQVEWSDIDPTWYVCGDCMNDILNPERATNEETDAHLAGYMDGLGDMLRSVLTEMVSKGDPALTVARNVIAQVESAQDVKL